MADRVTLPLKDTKGRPLMHKFYRQEGDVNGLLVIFPGGNYGMDGPLLYYPSELLQADGWDTLALTYSFQVEMKSISPDLFPDIMEECRTSVAAALSERTYPRVGLVGKSLGAAVVAYLCQTEPSLAGVRAAYLTPPMGTPMFDPIFAQTKQLAYLAAGSDDRFYDPQAAEALRATHLSKMTVIPGADHSMDVPGDLDASLEAVKLVVGEIVEFMKGD